MHTSPHPTAQNALERATKRGTNTTNWIMQPDADATFPAWIMQPELVFAFPVMIASRKWQHGNGI